MLQAVHFCPPTESDKNILNNLIIIKMWNKKEITKQKTTIDIDKELELYRKEKLLAIDIEIAERKQNNWNTLDEVRVASYKKIGEINSEVAKLEAKKESMTSELENLKNENIFLRETISQFAKSKFVVKS